MSSPRRGYVDGPFGQIHYQSIGVGPAVVLLHQAPMTSGQYDNVYAPLAAQGFQVIGVDMPGFGMSDCTPDTPTVEDYAQVVPPVLDAFGLKTAALLGHHTGGLAATAAALQWPERISALIVNGPLFLTDEERQAYFAGGHQTELAFRALPGGEHLSWFFKIREGFAAGTVSLERLSNYVVQAMIGSGKYWYGHHAAYSYEHDKALAKVVQPTLILTNTGDMIYDSALKARELRPDFAFVALEGGGVDIVDQQPQAWAEAVGRFLHDHAQHTSQA